MEKELKRHYMLIVDFLGHILGPDYEIALHELNDDSNEIIAIANGELTGRHLGSPLSNKMLEYVAGNLYETQNYVLNFESVSATGKTMCSNSMFIKGRSGELAGLLCINFDASRYEELAHRMSTPDAAANADEYARMMRDYKELTPLIEEYRRYTDLQQQEADAKEMLAAESDPAFAAMVQQELCEIGRNLAQSEENLRLLLIPKDADDEKSVILEIRAGAGGEEAALFAHTTNLGDYLSNAVLETETFCVRQAAAGQLSPVMEAALNSELNFLQKLCGLTLDALLEAADRQNRELAFLPRWEARQLDLTAAYNQRMREAGKKGYGMFAKHHVFTVENGQLVPVKYPDPQKLSELPGYEKEREKVIANTRALLAGSPANNVLLYGDAGTGKSSTVKAIANEYAADGLRLVEVKKNQLYQIPDLMDQLAANPLKFILFIDDLSFSSNDDNFAALKAILEGSVGGRARNIAVYATSNRRHLIKETLTDRTGDDIHEADTRQELMSLSARFGLTVTFQRPEKARFAAILEELAKQHHIQMPMEELLVKAEAFAIRAGGRSPRVAKQFIEQCESGVQK